MFSGVSGTLCRDSLSTACLPINTVRCLSPSSCSASLQVDARRLVPAAPPIADKTRRKLRCRGTLLLSLWTCCCLSARSMCGRPVPPCIAAKAVSHHTGSQRLGSVSWWWLKRAQMRDSPQSSEAARSQGREPDEDGAGRTGKPARAPRGPGFRERHSGGLGRRRGPTRDCCSGAGHADAGSAFLRLAPPRQSQPYTMTRCTRRRGSAPRGGPP